MVIYIILAMLIGIYALYPYSHHNSKYSRKIFLILAFTTMTIVLGLRASSVGEDTAMYLNVFEKAEYLSWNDIISNIWGRLSYQVLSDGYQDTIESSYLILCKIINIFTNNSQVYLMTISAIICFLFARFIYDNTEKVAFATYIFLCDAMFMFAFNGIRQMLAIAIALQAYKYIKKNKLTIAVLIMILAFCIHNTSVICLLIIPFKFIKRDKETKLFKYVLIFAVALPFIVRGASEIIVSILPRYEDYFTTNYWSNSIGGSSILLLVEFCLIIYMFLKKFSTKDSFMLSSLSAFYLVLELMGLSITMFSRVSYFYRAFLILFLPDAISSIRPKYRTFVKMGIIALLFLLYISMGKSSSRMYSFFF